MFYNYSFLLLIYNFNKNYKGKNKKALKKIGDIKNTNTVLPSTSSFKSESKKSASSDKKKLKIVQIESSSIVSKSSKKNDQIQSSSMVSKSSEKNDRNSKSSIFITKQNQQMNQSIRLL